ncbi:MAG: hypothetical protein E7666_00935 [Ruminococcaceae bacterium]|nr:hypothetical protein [Oscillospiraceae bacterium]
MQERNRIAAFFGLNKYHRAGAVSALLILLVLVLAITLNALTALLPHTVSKINLTGSDTFKLSSQTLDWLEHELDEDVTLYWLCSGGRAAADSDLYEFLLRFEEASDRVTLHIVDPATTSDSFIQAYGGSWPTDRSLIVESEKRYRILDVNELYYYYYYDGTNSMVLSAAEYQEMLMIMEDEKYAAQAETLLSFFTAYFDGNSRLTNAVNFVTRDDITVVYTLTGSGASALDSNLSYLLAQNCHEVRTTISIAALPEDCDVLLLNAPTTDLTDAEAAALSAYLNAGGKLFLTTFYAAADLPNLAKVLGTYGLGFMDEVNTVLENNPNYALSDSTSSYPSLFKVHLRADHPFGEGLENSFIVYFPHAITLTETEGVTLTSWLYTSAAGQLSVYNKTDKKWENSEKRAEYTVGAIAERGETQIVWISSPDALTANINAYTTGSANFALIKSVIDHLGNTANESISIPSAQIPPAKLAVTPNQLMIWSIVLVLVLPASALTVGIIVWSFRKKK